MLLYRLPWLLQGGGDYFGNDEDEEGGGAAAVGQRQNCRLAAIDNEHFNRLAPAVVLCFPVQISGWQ
jgi:hypothetical protein